MDKKVIRNKITDLFKESRPKALKGSLADGKTIKDIAKKHKVPSSTIRNQVDQGKMAFIINAYNKAKK